MSPDALILYLRCTESPYIARLRPSFRPPHALADCCDSIQRIRPLLPPFSSTPNKHRCHYIIQYHLLPSPNVGGTITPPPSHYSPVAVPTVYAFSPGIALGPDRSRPSPTALVLESWQNQQRAIPRRGSSHSRWAPEELCSRCLHSTWAQSHCCKVAF